MRRAFSLAAIVVFGIFPMHIRGQELPSPTDVRDAYERLDFDAALDLADLVVTNAESYAPTGLVEVHTVAALILISRGDRNGASGHFGSALSLDPQLRLDPSLASPEVVEFFESVRERTGNAPAPIQGVRYIPVHDPRASAAVRSMLLPGWGQLYKGQPGRGRIMMGLWGAAAAGTITSHFIRDNRRDRYLEETDPTLVPNRFDEFNRWHKVRNNLALTTIVVWGVSFLDALLLEAGDSPSTTRRIALEVYPAGHSFSPHITLRVPFGGGAQGMRTP